MRYRIWSSVDNRYVDNENVYVLKQNGKILALGGVSFNPERGMIAEFSTGLKDKNGVEIYKGDVVRSKSGRKVGEVVWSEKGTHFAIQGSKPHYINKRPQSKLWTLLGCEVIGNIHTTPELLK